MAKRKKKSRKKATKKKVAKKKVTRKKKPKKAKKKAAKKGAKKKKVAKKKTKKKAKRTTRAQVVAKKQINQKTVISIGQKVPNFSALATGEKSFELSQLENKKLVLFFYPKDSTPGCTVEGQDFTRLHEEFKNQNVEVLGVSRDSIKSHENFKANQNYTIDLLSDQDESLCSLFNVIKMKNMYGRQVRGIERSTFVIDENGTLVKEWRGVKVPGHADEVLNFVKNNF